MSDKKNKMDGNLLPSDAEKKRALLKSLLEKEKQSARQDNKQTVAKVKPYFKKRPDELSYLPLSFSQKALWFVDKINPDDAGYNTMLPLRLQGKLDLDDLHRTLKTLQQRHEVLRTSFTETDETEQDEAEGIVIDEENVHLSAVIHENLNIPLTAVDLSQQDDAQSMLKNIIQDEFERSFDLAKAPLYRAVLIKIDDLNHRLILTVHHIISDGWSTGVLYTEFCNIYRTYAENKESSLAPTVQYIDYAIAQRDHLTKTVLEKQLSYWQQQLSDVPQLNLPKDHTREAKQNYKGRSKTIMFSAVLSKTIRTLSKEQGVTTFVTMMSAFNLLMQRYSGQDDLVIGTPLMIRNTPELEKVVGLLVNMAVLRIHVPADVTFKEFLKSNRKMLLDAHDNSDLPFDYLVKTLQPQREANVNPFFQVVFAQDMVQSAALHRGHTVETLSIQVSGDDIDTGSKVTRFDVEAYLKDDGENLGVEFICNKQLFDETTVNSMLDNYVCLLEKLVNRADEQLSQFSLLDDTTRFKVLTQWNQTQTSYPRDKTVAQLFEQQVEATPAATAIIFQQQSYTYKTLNHKANQLAHYLINCGVKAEVMVALSIERSPDLIVAILAIIKAGGVYVPLDADLPQQRLSFMLDDINAHVLLTQSSLLKQLPEFKGQTICLDQQWSAVEKYSHHNLEVQRSARHLIYVMYTSGSTGKPKGVCIEHHSVVRLVKNTNFIRIKADDVFLQLAPISFDASTLEIWGALLNGAILVVYPLQKVSLEQLGEIIEEKSVTTLWLTSALFNQMVDQELPSLKAVKTLLAGGEALSTPHVKKYLTFLQKNSLSKHNLINGYGPTENTTFTCCCVMHASTRLFNSVPIGKPISNTIIYILDKNLNPVPPGITGELYIGGDGLAREYLNQPELTAEKFIVDPFSDSETTRLYRTGDLAKYANNGNVEFVGRVDNQIKLRGYRIELGEIETLLSGFESVSEVVILLREDISGDKRLVAYLVLKNTIEDAVATIREYCQDRLPAYMVPSAFVIMDEFPITKNGKIDHKALPVPDCERHLKNTFVAARGKLERAITDIWKSVLNLDDVGVEDNFFDLGGHSLLLIKVRKQIKSLLQYDIPVVKLFQHPTIKSLSATLQLDENNIKGEKSLLEEIKDSHVNGVSSQLENEPIAVIGLSGRFPGAGNIKQFWQNLVDGKESIRFFTEDELREAGVDEGIISHPDFVPAKGYLDDADQFDAQFFGFSPRDADFMDPQQRLFLMLAWQALENANVDPARYAGKIGVFAGCSENSYWFSIMNNEEIREAGMLENALAAGKDFLATRVAYKLDLHGPAITMQTACSTSLVAIHEACRSIINGECEMAMAGGASISAPLVGGYIYTPDSIASPDGHCRAFDESAAGTLGGDGGGIVVLKRLSQAIKDADIIHAVIKGSAINNDGASKVGYTAPSVDGQSEAIATAIINSGVDVSSISYIETHGTGTNLGDPIEIAALKKVYCDVDPENKVLIGSLKTNVGHLDAAAGVSSFIKTVLSLENKMIPPSLHFKTANPELHLEESPFQVNAVLTPWRESATPIRAGISSFGIGGTNAHVILEQAPDKEVCILDGDAEVSASSQLLILSAKNIKALDEMSSNLANALAEENYVLKDVAYTLQCGRSRLKYSRFFIASAKTGAIETLTSTAAAIDVMAEPTEQQVVFMFSGQGSQHINMGLELYNNAHCPIFHDLVDECLHYLEDKNFDLAKILFPDAGDVDTDFQADERITETRYAQPALFIFEVALAHQWIAWGVKPIAMIGHSIGEYAAACLAGVLSLHDALSLVVERGTLMHAMPAGSMLSVPLSSIECEQWIEQSNMTEQLSIATINTPEMTVVSGEDVAIEKFQAYLLDSNIDTRKLHTSHAFHSHMMSPMLDTYRQVVASVELKAPEIPYISNITGTWITAEEATNPEYYTNHIRQTVNFSAGLETLFDIGNSVFVEVGPGQVLQTLAGRHSRITKAVTVVASSPRISAAKAAIQKASADNDEINALLVALGRLHASGVNIDWPSFHAATGKVNKVILPNYPFQTQRFWIEPAKQTLVSTKLVRFADTKQWSYVPSWQRIALRTDITSQKDKNCWLFFIDAAGIATRLLNDIEKTSDTIVSVKAGKEFSQQDKHHYQINPQRLDDYEKLFSALKLSNLVPDIITHCWMIDYPTSHLTPVDDTILGKGFYSLIHLYKTLQSQLQTHSIKLALISSQCHDVNGTENIIAEKCMAMAAVKVMPMENPLIKTRLIDIVLDETVNNEIFINTLSNDLRTLWQQPVTAYRGNYRWAQTFEQIPLDSPDSPAEDIVVSGGNYVITGGLGHIGLQLATALSSIHNINLHLVSRRQMPSHDLWLDYINQHSSEHDEDAAIGKIVKRLLALEANGSRVYIHQADAADENLMQQLFTQIEKISGRVNGIISCVGADKQSLSMALLDKSHCEKQFNTRIKSLHVLEKVLQDRVVDFCVITSSLASVMGVMDFVSYTAVHQYIDAFIYQHNRRSANISSQPQWICINWDNWLIDDPIEEAESTSTSISIKKPVTEFYMKTDEGQRIFLEILRQKIYSHLYISTGDLQSRINQWSSIEKVDDDSQQAEKNAQDSVQGHPRPALGTPYVIAETEAEKLLTTVWQQVLGLREVGIHDNFFELGGDSVLNIQITSRARQVGIFLTPKQVFEHQTIHELASVAGGDAVIAAEQSAITGEVLLTPIQCWLFERQLPQLGHFNLPMILRLNESMDSKVLEKTMCYLINHHDALRLRYVEQQGRWKQYNDDVIDQFDIEVIDISAVPAAEQPAQIELIVNQIQRNLDITSGPLLRTSYINTGRHAKPVLVLMVHHLLVDVVSWRILLEDIQKCYLSLKNNTVPVLPQKTTSYKYWSHKLTDFAQSSQLLSSLDYWRQLADRQFMPVPSDSNGDNSIASTETFFVELDEEETRTLLTILPTKYGVGISDLLVFALMKSLCKWMDGNTIVLNLEGHGREPIFDDVDVSRTIGWFTSIYPVYFEIDDRETITQQIMTVHQQAKEVPFNGMAYGLLRYLTKDDETAAVMASLPTAEISFLYMGQLDQAFGSDSLFAFSNDAEGQPHDPTATRAHLLEINSLVKFDKFMAGWSYSEKRHKTATIKKVATDFINELKNLISQLNTASDDKVAASSMDSAYTSDSISKDDLAAILRKKM